VQPLGGKTPVSPLRTPLARTPKTSRRVDATVHWGTERLTRRCNFTAVDTVHTRWVLYISSLHDDDIHCRISFVCFLRARLVEQFLTALLSAGQFTVSCDLKTEKIDACSATEVRFMLLRVEQSNL